MAEVLDDRWKTLLPTRNEDANSAAAMRNVAGKRILLTGAGGSIGSALATEIFRARPRELVLLDHSEQALYELGRQLSSEVEGGQFLLVAGDAGDRPLLDDLLAENRPDLILHAAAYKHVPLMEENPFAAVKNNAIATWELARAAAEHRVPQFLLVSTDKVANPRSILGASKKIAEQSVLRWAAPGRNYSAIRLVNVLGSAGSAAPLFLQQIQRGGPVTVTHPDAARHFLTLAETVELILLAAALPAQGALYVPKVGEPLKIVELVEVLARQVGGSTAKSITIEFIGLRPGEKIVEELFSRDECLVDAGHPALQALRGFAIPGEELDVSIEHLAEAVRRRDLARLLEIVCRLVSDYRPSRKLCQTEPAADD